jgi:Tfp pilus assembly protein FimT
LAAGSTMTNSESGFTTFELFVVVAVMGIILAMALPQAFNSLKGYRVHTDASEIAGYLNVERMRAASQSAPYALDVNGSTYAIEQLTPLTYDPLAMPTSTSYTSQNPAVYDFGTQYLAPGDTVTNCLVSGVSVYPPPVTANPGTCGTPFQVYFNTRGLPVDITGNALAGGGVAIYLKNTKGMVDAVTVSSGGAVQVWNWNPPTSSWALR